jgi:hypothetical protein
MIPEKDPERENTYYVKADVAEGDDENDNGFFDKLYEIFRF